MGALMTARGVFRIPLTVGEHPIPPAWSLGLGLAFLCASVGLLLLEMRKIKARHARAACAATLTVPDA